VGFVEAYQVVDREKEAQFNQGVHHPSALRGTCRTVVIHDQLAIVQRTEQAKVITHRLGAVEDDKVFLSGIEFHTVCITVIVACILQVS